MGWNSRSPRNQHRHAAAKRRASAPKTRSSRFELLEDRRLLTTLLGSFNGADGDTPLGGLTLSADGSTFYGTTVQLGQSDYGTVFSIPVTGGTPTALGSFVYADGADPRGSLTLSANGSTLYGTATTGGANGHGAIFSIPVTGGAPVLLGSFNTSDGAAVGNLTLSGSTLYGTTAYGGAGSDGAIFSIPVTGGTPMLLGSFNGTDGDGPDGGLTLSGSTFYGTTYSGGANGDGAIFSIPVTGGTPTALVSFNGTDGQAPTADLTLSGSTFYGTTQYGGANGDGTVFSIPVSGGTPTVLLSFDGTDGTHPEGSLTLSGSTLYGTTLYGGVYGDGTVFSVPVAGGTPTVLDSFGGTGSDGQNPQSDLTLIGSTLYGTTVQGGADNYGTVFSTPEVNSPPVVAASVNTGQTYTLGGSPVAVDSGITVTSGDSDITGASMTITDYQVGDAFGFSPEYGISGSQYDDTLTLSGSATPAQYQAALQSVYFYTTNTNTTPRTIDVYADDSNASYPQSNEATDSVNVVLDPPVVTTSGSTGQTYTLGGSAVAVDSGVTVTSSRYRHQRRFDADRQRSIGRCAQLHSDRWHHHRQQLRWPADLDRRATPAQYTAALQSVTFSTTSIDTTTRTVDVVADDSAASPTTSNTGVDTVKVAIAAPVVTTSGFQTLLSFDGPDGDKIQKAV